ncbi:ABC transporter permease [Nocardia sp. NPDC048505]|uniref:ABC transporter permease n=1 Tax=unclassified Nocardia TaxID=2637762 RepID=UPI0033DA8DFD
MTVVLETSRCTGFTGTAGLIRFALRRDRVVLPLWLSGLTLLGVYFATAIPQLYPTDADLRGVGRFSQGVTGALVAGPGYGFTDPTVESVVVGLYGLYFLVLAGLLNIQLIARHTRAEEQTGRAELLRSNVVGRYAQLTAALSVAVAVNVALALAISSVFVLTGLDTSGALLFGAGIGAAGLVFAGLAAVTVQITEYSRAATGLAGAALGVAYVVRAAGDSIQAGGSTLSWFSPLAWSQQTRAYVEPRWWPLALSVTCAAIAAGLSYALLSRRDLNAGLIAPRRGPAYAPQWLNSTVALAYRLQRAGLIGWSAGLVATGLLYGGLTRSLLRSFDELPGNVVEVMGGDPDRMIDGYLSTMSFLDALLVTIFVILGVQGLRREESRGYAEPVLAAGAGRGAWFGSWMGVLAAGAAALLFLNGAALGVAAAVALGDSGYIPKVVAAHMVYLPAVLVVLGLAAVLFGMFPRLIGVVWAVFGLALVLGLFGSIMRPPQWVVDLSPFEHVAGLPLESVRWSPLLVLALLAATLLAIGGGGFRRRDLDSK